MLTGAVAFAGTAGTVSAALGRDYGTDQPQRYPDPDIVILDNRFARKVWNTSIERLYTGTLWAEGPAWNAVGRYLIWSDIPGNQTLRWLEEDNHVSRRFRSPSDYTNGNTFDYQGRQIACQHETRRVARYEHDGQITALADTFQGKGFNAPNDVVVYPDDGSIWFTDAGSRPMRATGCRRRRRAPASSQGGCLPDRRRRQDHDGRRPALQAQRPLFLERLQAALCLRHRHHALSGGEGHHLDVRSRWREADEPANLREHGDGRQDRRRRRLRCDEEGNLWVAAGWVGDGYDGVHVFAPDGKRIDQIRLPEVCANLCFGGSKRNGPFMAASQSLYACYVAMRGAHIT